MTARRHRSSVFPCGGRWIHPMPHKSRLKPPNPFSTGFTGFTGWKRSEQAPGSKIPAHRVSSGNGPPLPILIILSKNRIFPSVKSIHWPQRTQRAQKRGFFVFSAFSAANFLRISGHPRARPHLSRSPSCNPVYKSHFSSFPSLERLV